MRRKISLWSLALVSLAACASPPPPAVPPAPAPPPDPATAPPPAAAADDLRKAPPSPGPEVQFVPPKIQEARLANGLRLLLVERHELPVVAVEIAVDRGADQASPAVGGFVGAMLTQGTRSRSALDFSDAMGRMGARFGSAIGYDGGGLGAQALASHFPELLSLLGEATTSPAFDRAEVERERSRRLTSLAQINDNPGSLLGIAVGRALYPETHPYAAPVIGTEAALKQLKPADLAAFHAAHVRPDRVTVAIAGDVTRDQAMREVERVFGGWMGAGMPAKEPAAPPADAAGPRVILVDRPGLTQSSVAVGLPGVARSSPDYEALIVLNTILGGQFSSRINLNLREKHAYTYGARSGFEMRHGPGPFTAGGAIVRESTGPAVKELLSEIRRIREEPVSDEELSSAKSNLIQQLPAQFETVGATASTLAGLAIQHLPLDEYANRAAKIQRVTREDVQRVARQYLVPERMKVVLVGDGAVVKAQLEPLGLGAIEVQSSPAAAPAADAAGGAAAAGGKPAKRP